MMQPGIEPRSPGPLANTLPASPMRNLYFHVIGKLAINIAEKSEGTQGVMVSWQSDFKS